MATTEHRNWPLPDPAQTVREEFEQLLAVTFPMMDADMKTALAGLAEKAARDHGHGIPEIEGLEQALLDKMPAARVFALADMADVEGVAEAPDGYILTKVGDKVIMVAASAVLGEHNHTILQVNGLTDALASKLSKAESLADLQDVIAARTNLKIWTGTQAQYDALTSKDAQTIYITT